ncbi:hypothetical protein MIND_00992400 [Mycena indigotica]|uniref:BTB domain-containing protein n=1 Tax=Mycena indigotica TaxID=2126181 RepID=A0A8H6S807_9AGAR|nr:uncharacterized protein MIND_00992400 [Mycena indigotica]KAF7294559.1 hypothetical protein MIND_00992400 [Mycena indigotica]
MSSVGEGLGEGNSKAASVSQRFNFPDSDIAFRSSDNVIFRTHTKNLETHAEGFPPSAFAVDLESEIVNLTETAETLELLFQYVYPQRQPDLTTLPFNVLADLAEAAEKYQIFSAMDILRIFMGNGLQDNALTVLNYAVRHDYLEIADEAAPLTISLPLDQIGKHMHANYMGSWLRYYSEWQEILELACSEGWRIGHTAPCRITANVTACPHWNSARQSVLTKLGARPGALNDLAKIFTTAHGLYPCAIESLRQWEYFIAIKVRDLPQFRTFL